MKKLAIAFLVLFVVAGVAFSQQRFANGNRDVTVRSYDASAPEGQGGGRGELSVRVTFRGNRMTQITVRNYTDSSAFISMVTSTMIPAMIQAQNSNVDVVAGATYTANALREAVATAMAQARR